MDTPERSKIGGAPLSKFEDSPIFNFINNLSPIQPVKSAHGAQVFQSLSFASISSVFSSPHINLQKESKVLIRPPDSHLSKLEISLDNLDPSNLCSEISASDQENNIICSLNEAPRDPPEECSTEDDDLPHPIQYDSGSPNHKTGLCYGVKVELKLDSGQNQVEVAQFDHNSVEKKKVLFPTEIELQEEHQFTQIAEEEHQFTRNTEEVIEGGWENLISENADDMLVFDSPINSDNCKGQAEKYESNGADSLICSSQKPEDFTEISEKAVDISPGPCFQNTAQYPPLENNEEAGEKQGRGHTLETLLDTCQNQVAPDDQNQETKSGSGGCIGADFKVESQQQRGMRRRCLTFESAGTSNNKSNLHPSVTLPSSRRLTSEAKKPLTLKSGSSSSSCILPSIGLHLNALATSPQNRGVKKEAIPFVKQLFSTSCSISPFPPITAGRNFLNKATDVENNLCPTNSEVQKLEVMHDDASEPSELGLGEDLSQSSPKKKRRKSENGGENEACKRCNCKKSKCLKLYCECFAAGVYCVEPCSCHGCFNKPIHEETVLATRKQIESRNPLAFAPKVIRASDPVEEMGEETNKTPSSARHKRGCNCKKSSCLKKYCECYQGGVGCSPSCRCEGCKNAFGRKDAEDVEEVMDVCEKQVDKPHENHLIDAIQKNENPSSESISLPSFETCRSSVKLPFHSSGKPPRSSSLSIGYPTSQALRRCALPLLHHKLSNRFKSTPEDDTPEILKGDAAPNNGVKTVSPNGKRVSPPHNTRCISPNRKGGRKLILKSIPSFPSLNSETSNGGPLNYSSSPFSSSALN